MTIFEREDELRLLRPPRLRTLGGEDGRRASYLELFFDPVFVVAIAQLAHELVVDHSLRGIAVFAALYLPVFLAWQGFSFYADRFDTDDLVFRLTIGYVRDGMRRFARPGTSSQDRRITPKDDPGRTD